MSGYLGPTLGHRLPPAERKPHRALAPPEPKLPPLRKPIDREAERQRIEHLRRQNRLPLWQADDEPRPRA